MTSPPKAEETKGRTANGRSMATLPTTGPSSADASGNGTRNAAPASSEVPPLPGYWDNDRSSTVGNESVLSPNGSDGPDYFRPRVNCQPRPNSPSKTTSATATNTNSSPLKPLLSWRSGASPTPCSRPPAGDAEPAGRGSIPVRVPRFMSVLTCLDPAATDVCQVRRVAGRDRDRARLRSREGECRASFSYVISYYR